MVLNRLIGTALDDISLSNHKVSAYRVMLYDLSADDTISDLVLEKHTQVGIDITPWVRECTITSSNDTEANQADFQLVGGALDWRLFLFSWVKVYKGDARVDSTLWPIVFSGIFRGQPARVNERGQQEVYQASAYDRSVMFRNSTRTSRRSWQPQDTDANLGTICRQIATDPNWGMGLDNQEVLFGKFFDGVDEMRINKKLQMVDIPLMDALRNIMQVVQREPAFNAEGKLVARRVDLDRPPARIYQDDTLIVRKELPINTLDLLTSVTVRGLDFRQTRLDYMYQKLVTVGPVTIGMFAPQVKTVQPYSENNQYRVVVDSTGTNVNVQGSLLAQIFNLDDRIDVDISPVDDFSAECTITLHGAYIAILIVTISLGLYIGLRLAADAIGASNPFNSVIAFALDAVATVLLFLVMQMMTAIGTCEFEVWGTPFEYVYQELEAKAFLSDAREEEDETEEVTNHIIGTLADARTLARAILRRKVAETAQRTLTVSEDFLIEPNDILELEEEGETARYYVLETNRTVSRPSEDGSLEISAFRVR